MNAKKIIKKCLDNQANLQDFKVFQVLTEFDPEDETSEDNGATLKSDSYWNEIQLLESEVDSIARYLFLKYREYYNSEHPEKNDFIDKHLQYDLEWDELPEIQRARWRERADGWEVKARAAGGRIVVASSDSVEESENPTKDKSNLLADLDYTQHCASLALAGEQRPNDSQKNLRIAIVEQIIDKTSSDLSKFRNNEIFYPVYFIKK